MKRRSSLHGTVAASVFLVSCFLTVFPGPAARAADPAVEIVNPADGAVLLWTNIQGNQQWSLVVAAMEKNNSPPCYAAVVEYRTSSHGWTHMSSIDGPVSVGYPMSFPITWFGDDALYRVKAAANEECKNYSIHDIDDWIWTDWTQYTIDRVNITLLQAEEMRASTRRPIEPTMRGPEVRAKLEQPGGEPMTPMSGEGMPGPGTALTSPPPGVKVNSLAADRGSSQVKIVKPTSSEVLKWSLPTGTQGVTIEVEPKNPAFQPACYSLVTEYHNQATGWYFATGKTRTFPQPVSYTFSGQWYGPGPEASYRIKAAANDGCVNFNHADEGGYNWTPWTYYTVERTEITMAQVEAFKAGSAAPGGGMTPRSGDAPSGFGAALTALPSAIQAAGLPKGDGSSEMRIVNPTDGRTIYHVLDRTGSTFSVKAAPVDPANSPDCYLVRTVYRKQGKGSPWQHNSGAFTVPVGNAVDVNIALDYVKDAEQRVEVARWTCGVPEPNPRDFDADDTHAIKYEVKEALVFAGEVPEAMTARPGQPAPPGKAVLKKEMRALPGVGPSKPRNGDVPKGIGAGAAIAPVALKKVRLPPGDLTIDEFVKLSDPRPGHTVNVKVKLRNQGGGPTVKDEWKLEVKCYQSPGGSACEQQLGSTPLAAIKKGDFEWILRSGAVKVNAFGSYKLQANVGNGRKARSAYLEFKISPDRKMIQEAPVEQPDPEPQVQQGTPAPRKITPRMQPMPVR